MPSKNDCLPGRSQRIYNPENHFVTGAPMSECMSKKKPRILFGMGCFWGAEKMFWDLDYVRVQVLAMPLDILRILLMKKFVRD